MLTPSPGQMRGGGGSKALPMIHAGEHITELTLLGSGAKKGKLKEELVNPDGDTVWSKEVFLTAAQAKSGKVSLIVAGQILSPNDYQIKLSQTNSKGESTEIATYAFRVLRPR